MNNLTAKEENFFSTLPSLIEKHYDSLLEEFQNLLLPLIYENINLLNLKLLKEFVITEINSFLIFLKRNTSISTLRGKKVTDIIKNEKIVLLLPDIFRTLFTKYIREENYNTTWKIINSYMMDYLSAFIKEREFIRQQEREQLYNSLLEVVGRQREEILEKEKEQNRQRTAFSINLAHEIKLPITIIRNQINMIIEEASNRQLKTIPPLAEQIRSLQEMIVNIFDYEKILQGKMLYNHDTIVNISRAVTAKVDLFKALTLKKNISMESKIQEDLYIRIDPLSLDRIFNNIIDNAIKFNQQKGSIHITVKAAGDSVYFIVQDTGIGIHSDQLKHIFKPYYQSVHKRRINQGIGAGLCYRPNGSEKTG